MKHDEFDFYKMHLKYVIDQIMLADRKIHILLIIYMSIFGLLVTKIDKMKVIFSSGNIISKTLFVILTIANIYFLFMFLTNYFRVIRPRTEVDIEEPNYKSSIFWGHIALYKYHDFEKIPMEKRYSDLKKQVYINSFIANEKFKYVSKSYDLFIPAIFTFVVYFLIVSF